MGADFMFAVAPTCNLTQERKTKVKDLLRSLPDDYFVEHEDTHCTFGDDELSGAELRTMFYEIVLRVNDICTRETSSISLPGMDWEGVITGGMSWGDSPTECYDDIAAIDNFYELFELLVQFSREDFAERANA
jgi:hypothetical protein